MNRRNFLAYCLAAGMAPAIVRAPEFDGDAATADCAARRSDRGFSGAGVDGIQPRSRPLPANSSLG